MSSAPPALRDKNNVAVASDKQSYCNVAPRCTYDVMERDRIGFWGSGDGEAASRLSGLDRLKHPGLNKVCSFLLCYKFTNIFFAQVMVVRKCTKFYNLPDPVFDRDLVYGRCQVFRYHVQNCIQLHVFELNSASKFTRFRFRCQQTLRCVCYKLIILTRFYNLRVCC